MLATSSRGGAGIAALRSFKALEKAGIDVEFFSLDKQINFSGDAKSVAISIFTTLTRKFLTFTQRIFIQKSQNLVTPVSLDSFSQFSKNLSGNYDIIHVHAFYNLLSIKGFSSLNTIGKKVVFTLHDERLFTGGCHYSGACNQFEASCSSCPLVPSYLQAVPRKAQELASEYFLANNEIAIIAPSDWIAYKGMKSKSFQNKQIHVLRNPIPDLFFEVSPIKIENVDTKLRIGFSSFSLSNPLKGFKLLLEALSSINNEQKRQLKVILATQNSNMDLPEDIEFLIMSPSNELELKEFYGEIDVLVVPSLEDNSPSVIGEALAMGVPVIGSNIGGIPEILNEFQQPIFDSGDSNALAEALSGALKGKINAVDRELAQEIFSNSAYSSRVMNIYKL